MRVFTLTRRAKADLKSIAAYTQRKWGKEQRKFYTLQFDNVFHQLTETPGIGTKCDVIKPGYYKFPVSSHIIFYRKADLSEIEIVRILYKRIDVKTPLEKP